ncbi:MAG TPA: SRPBCC domain-containing protein, partial [Puia sp.]|nr:SRPBCC domain-containing protein [Puia sp.]
KHSTMEHETKITRNPGEKKLLVIREFNAPVEKVWQAFTKQETLDLWWAPRPWKTETKSLDFEPGGLWLYSMVGPNGDRHHCRVEFTEIIPQRSFNASSGFCDENGVPNPSLPLMHWHTLFTSTSTGSKIDVTIRFDKEADLKTIVEMGFEAGFTMALGNLDELLEGVTA